MEIKEILDDKKVIIDQHWNCIIIGNEKYYDLPKRLLDYITNLQQENERLKEENKYLDELRNANYLSWQDSLSRIEKAVKYIENTPLYETTYDYNIEEELEIQNVSDETASNKLLNILNGKE